MAQVTVRINGYAYTVGCEDGQEAHLQAMAEQVEQRINSIKALGGQTGEAKLLVLAALLMADELHDQGIELRALRHAQSHGPAAGGADRRDDGQIAAALTRLAEQAEAIAAELEAP